jgi:hypothetical protein
MQSSEELSTSLDSHEAGSNTTQTEVRKSVRFIESPFSMMFHTNFDETHPHILPPTERDFEEL